VETTDPGKLLDPRAIAFREQTRSSDVNTVGEMTSSTGFFSTEEIAIAEELIQTAHEKGPGSGYRFLFAESPTATVGFTCYGPIPGTRSSYDLYWIVVHRAFQGAGWGARLLAETETRVRAQGGTRIYADTSSRAQYEPTRRFYEKNGFRQAARLEDFYAPGDGKVIYQKIIG